MKFSGRVWRHVPAGAHPLNVGYILKARGRWNRAGLYGCLYTALTADGALAELRKVLAVSRLSDDDLLPRDLVSLDVTVQPVLDLTAAAVRSRIGVELSTLVGDEAADIEDCRRVADRAREEGYRAILAPSAAKPGERILILFLEGRADQLDIAEGPGRQPIRL